MLFSISYSKFGGLPQIVKKVMKQLFNYAARPLISYPGDAETFLKTGVLADDFN